MARASADVLPFSRDQVPMHYQVRDFLIQEIAEGRLRPGDRIPTEAQLIERFGVSRTPVRQALLDLVHRGLVQRRGGKGTFVAPQRMEQELTRLTGFVEDVEPLGLVASAKVVSNRTVLADERVAKHLDLAAGTEVVYLERVRLANEHPVSFDMTWLPKGIGHQIAAENLEVHPIFSLFENKYGITLGDAEYVIEASSASKHVAKHLDVPVGSPILLIERTTFSASGGPIDYELLHYRADRVSYKVRLARGQPK